jgi:hypothetical protein
MLKISFREGHQPNDIHNSNDTKGIMEFYKEFPKVTKNLFVILTSLVWK